MYHGYGYDGSGDPWGMWILLAAALLVFAGALALIIVTLFRHRAGPPGPAAPVPGPGSPRPRPDALRILDERLARGEIDGDEYTRRRSLIEGPG